jgi:hypothetical protein
VTAREREVARLSRRIARELVSDLVTGRPRATTGQTLVSVLQRAAARRPTGPRSGRPRSPALRAGDARSTFLAIAMNRDELEDLRARAAGAGLSLSKWGRVALGLPERRS